MNNEKANGYPKLLVFFLVAVVLIFAVGLVADGWQQEADSPVDNNSDKIEAPDNDNVDNDKDTETEIPDEPEIYIPEYINPLTGLETTEILDSKRHGAFIFNSDSPLYGISYSDLTIEVPTENNSTRFIAFLNDFSQIGKIGAISPTRSYISDIVNYFGGFPVNYGSDGISSVVSPALYGKLDFSLTQGYHYTEFGNFAYSNGNLLTGALNASGISLLRDPSEKLPFNFTPFGSNDVVLKDSAVSITLPFTESYTTELRYSSADSKYTLIKNGTARHDMLTNKVLSFDNCLILFADTVTYESKDGCNFSMDTSGSGIGYYATNGTQTKISWSVLDDGELLLCDEKGELLTFNRGNTYISYLKASLYDKTIFS